MSGWHPKGGQGMTISPPDLSMAMMALANYARHMHVKENVKLAKRMLKDQADFLGNVLQTADGSVSDGYNLATRAPLDGPRTLLAQSFAIRGFIEAYKELKDESYLKAAIHVYDFMNANLWDDQTGVYRSHVVAEVTEYTPLNLGAAVSAMREIILITKDVREIERYKRFWVQGVNSSGIQ